MLTKTKQTFKTYGLTHITLAVKDLQRSVDFYTKVFGAETMYLKEDFAQITTPGSNDIIVFEKKPGLAGKSGGGIMHFGFRLTDPKDIVKVKEVLKEANAIVTDSGEFVSGEPYIFFKDPDGYEIEIWYEKT
jgi:catechol 2,3-dioxygenase-like lactoylglutathione lyase family enzyme